MVFPAVAPSPELEDDPKSLSPRDTRIMMAEKMIPASDGSYGIIISMLIETNEYAHCVREMTNHVKENELLIEIHGRQDGVDSESEHVDSSTFGKYDESHLDISSDTS
jgi:hypothetical protein